MSKRVLKLLTSSVCLLMLTAASVRAEDPVYFADANLKAAVEYELGITDPTLTDMLSLTVLVAWRSGIEDLTGIEGFENLIILEGLIVLEDS